MPNTSHVHSFTCTVSLPCQLKLMHRHALWVISPQKQKSQKPVLGPGNPELLSHLASEEFLQSGKMYPCFYPKYFSLHFWQTCTLKCVFYLAVQQITMTEYSTLSTLLRIGFLYIFGTTCLRTHSDPKQNLVKRNSSLFAIQNKDTDCLQVLSCSFLTTLKINSCGNLATLRIPVLNALLYETGRSPLLW